MMPADASGNNDAAPIWAPLDKLFKPRSVAIIGASASTENLISSASIRNLMDHGFSGKIYPVNPSRPEVFGLQAYASVCDIPEPVDLAMIVVGRERVAQALLDCDRAGVAIANVASGGITAEEILALGLKRVRVLGPEAMGPSNLADGIVIRAARNQLGPGQTRSGSVAIVSQSGATSNILFNRAQAHGVGVAYSLNTGRESDLGVWDVVNHLADDDAVSCMMVVIEGISKVDRFIAATRRAKARRKPVILLELGRSAAGAAAVQTHSGALAGSAVVHAEAFRRLGVVTVDDFDELWRTALLFSRWGVVDEPSASRRLGVISLSGGEGALIADRADRAGLEMPALPAKLAQSLASEFPEASVQNPLDPTTRVLSTPARARAFVSTVLGDDGFTDVLFAFPTYSDEWAEARIPSMADALAEKKGARVVISSWSAPPLTTRMDELMATSGVPRLGTSIEALDPIANHFRYGDLLRERDPGLAAPDPVQSDAAIDPTYAEARAVFAGMGLKFPRSASVGLDVVSDLEASLSGMRAPFVVKADVASTVHKAAVGLVRLGRADAAEVREAMEAMARTPTRPVSFVVEEQLRGDWELFVGGKRDPEFGPVLLFGTGGTLSEALGDVAVAILPSSGDDLRALVARSAVGRELLRHAAPADAVGRLMSALADWFVDAQHRYESFDLNPVLLGRDGSLSAVDARLAVPPRS